MAQTDPILPDDDLPLEDQLNALNAQRNVEEPEAEVPEEGPGFFQRAYEWYNNNRQPWQYTMIAAIPALTAPVAAGLAVFGAGDANPEVYLMAMGVAVAATSAVSAAGDGEGVNTNKILKTGIGLVYAAIAGAAATNAAGDASQWMEWINASQHLHDPWIQLAGGVFADGIYGAAHGIKALLAKYQPFAPVP